MKIAIMQPYFLPYIGYFQLINAVDTFVVYDNIKYTKKGWINRNRILVEGKDQYISLPLRKDSDDLFVVQRFLATEAEKELKKLLNKVCEVYRKAPYFDQNVELLNKIFLYNDHNLFSFIYNSISLINEHLGIKTQLIVSSTLEIDHSLKAEKKVLAICKYLNADFYLNPIGGLELYSKNEFRSHNVELYFLKPKPIIYQQFNHEFVSWLSIIDVLMFNPKGSVVQMLNEFELL